MIGWPSRGADICGTIDLAWRGRVAPQNANLFVLHRGLCKTQNFNSMCSPLAPILYPSHKFATRRVARAAFQWRSFANAILWVVFKWCAFVAVVVAAALAATVAVTRTLLPNTCAISEAQIENLSMEMKYDTVKELLRCDGVLVSKEDYGPIVIEYYAWRGSAWPYGRLHLEFMNSTLQGTQKLWLNLSLSMRR